MSAKKETFPAHLRRLRDARRRTDELLAGLPASEELAQRAQRLAWLALYDVLCLPAGERDLTQLRHLSDVVLKLVRARRLAPGQSPGDAAAAAPAATAGLPDELRATLERELGLLG